MSELLNEAAHPRTDRPGSTAPGWSRMQVPAGKLSPPPLGFGPLLRPRLLEALSRGVAETPVTLLSGPAGSGKTLLASSWALEQHDHPPVAWLSLDAADDDPSMFWPYLLAALDRAGIELAVAPSEPGPAGSTPMGWPVSPAAALSGLQQRVVLIIDGADNLITPALTQALDLLVRHSGGRLRLVLCARADPLLPLHRYRLDERLTEIRTDQLAFTVEETSELLASLGAPVSPVVAALLQRETEGWAAALRLAAAPLARGVDPAHLLTALTADDGSVAQYLVAEVLDNQPAPGPPLPAADQRDPRALARPGRLPRRPARHRPPHPRRAGRGERLRRARRGRPRRLPHPRTLPGTAAGSAGLREPRRLRCLPPHLRGLVRRSRSAAGRGRPRPRVGRPAVGGPAAHRRPRGRPRPGGRSSLRTAAVGRRTPDAAVLRAAAALAGARPAEPPDLAAAAAAAGDPHIRPPCASARRSSAPSPSRAAAAADRVRAAAALADSLIAALPDEQAAAACRADRRAGHQRGRRAAADRRSGAGAP